MHLRRRVVLRGVRHLNRFLAGTVTCGQQWSAVTHSEAAGTGEEKNLRVGAVSDVGVSDSGGGGAESGGGRLPRWIESGPVDQTEPK